MFILQWHIHNTRRIQIYGFVSASLTVTKSQINDAVSLGASVTNGIARIVNEKGGGVCHDLNKWFYVWHASAQSSRVWVYGLHSLSPSEFNPFTKVHFNDVMIIVYLYSFPLYIPMLFMHGTFKLRTCMTWPNHLGKLLWFNTCAV